MSQRDHRARIALPGAALAVTTLLFAGCSASRPDDRPSVNLGPDVSTTTGMPAMSMVPSTSGAQQGTPPAARAGHLVTIDSFAFVPATVTVTAGSSVTWSNNDEEPHTVAASDGSFHSPGMGAHGTYSRTFATVGTFDYVCSLHPFMHGTVVVTP